MFCAWTTGIGRRIWNPSGLKGHDIECHERTGLKKKRRLDGSECNDDEIFHGQEPAVLM
jgi:hypothetical protein